jgi:hypothetical protein
VDRTEWSAQVEQKRGEAKLSEIGTLFFQARRLQADDRLSASSSAHRRQLLLPPLQAAAILCWINTIE